MMTTTTTTTMTTISDTPLVLEAVDEPPPQEQQPMSDVCPIVVKHRRCDYSVCAQRQEHKRARQSVSVGGDDEDNTPIEPLASCSCWIKVNNRTCRIPLFGPCLVHSCICTRFLGEPVYDHACIIHLGQPLLVDSVDTDLVSPPPPLPLGLSTVSLRRLASDDDDDDSDATLVYDESDE